MEAFALIFIIGSTQPQLLSLPFAIAKARFLLLSVISSNSTIAYSAQTSAAYPRPGSRQFARIPGPAISVNLTTQSRAQCSWPMGLRSTYVTSQCRDTKVPMDRRKLYQAYRRQHGEGPLARRG